MGKRSSNVDRGNVKTITLKKSITFNGNVIKKAVIEIDHINHGLDSQGKLKKKKRTSFTINHIEKFLMMLDTEYVIAKSHRGRISRFEFKIDCPIPGQFKDRLFIMIFEMHYDKADEIHTITLFPGW